jgi:EAL domain-containing protein (putative c-di-GMP-specific phosphodiesterase class I)
MDSDAAPSSTAQVGRVLVVDDEPEPLRAFARVLRHAGYIVDSLGDGRAALAAIQNQSYDAIVSDISMPNMDGIELLQLVRHHDEDVPVILITGAPAVETAVMALEHGAYKYLVKPVTPERLEEVVQKAVRLRQMARIRREALDLIGPVTSTSLRTQFKSAMKSLWIAYQPIVRANGELYGHEALMRTREAALGNPALMLQAAERLHRLGDLGREVRRLAAAPATDRPDAAGTLFVNLHPNDLDDDLLYSKDGPLAALAERVVLEITERASVENIQDLRSKVARLRTIGYRIAVDDLGAGYAGLTSFALLEPEIVKIDMSLVRDIDKMPVKQRLVASLSQLCREMGIMVVAEGVETAAERDTLVGLGCDLLQGYYFAKPGQPFPEFRW